VKRVLTILEAVEFKWTINQVLEQDEKWAHDIFLLKGIGDSIYSKERDEALEDG